MWSSKPIAILLLLVAPAASLQMLQEVEVDKAECHTAEVGEPCYLHVAWAMEQGIAHRPEQYPGLTSGSSFEEFQLHLHQAEGSNTACARPCERAKPELANLAAVQQQCDPLSTGDTCFAKVHAAMRYSIARYPDDYKSLAPGSSLDDLKVALQKWNKLAGVCQCDSEKREPAPAQQDGPNCHNAVKGESCYKEVTWAMSHGIFESPAWYKTKQVELTNRSTFTEFQAFLHGLDKNVCPAPCLAEAQCHTAVTGEHCFSEVAWAMRFGIKERPGWYPSLTSSSTFEDFQAHLHGLDTYSQACGAPCAAEVCKTAMKDDKCHAEVTWAMESGIKEHPEWYPGLTPESSFADFQAFLHTLDNLADTCPKPCVSLDAEDAKQKPERLQKTKERFCHTAKWGSDCYREANWLKTEGIKQYPAWFPSLSQNSTFVEIQSFLHGLAPVLQVCFTRPCEEGEPGFVAETETPRQKAADETSSMEQPDPSDEKPVEEEDLVPIQEVPAATAAAEEQAAEEQPMAPPAEETDKEQRARVEKPKKYHESKQDQEKPGDKPILEDELSEKDYPERNEASQDDSSYETPSAEPAKTMPKKAWADAGSDKDSKAEDKPPPLEWLFPAKGRVVMAEKEVLAPENRVGSLPPLPARAGCFVWLPSGCKGNPPKTDWKRDRWGEENKKAGEDKDACRSRRKSFNSFCGVADSVMRYVTTEDLPEGAAADSVRTYGDYKEEIGGSSRGASLKYEDAPAAKTSHHKSKHHKMKKNKSSSLTGGDRVHRQLEPWGSTEDGSKHHKSDGANAKLWKVQLPKGAPELPDSAGCFVWLPTGCKTRAFPASLRWKRDGVGESALRAAESQAACAARKNSFDAFCGVENAVMFHVSTDDIIESEVPFEEDDDEEVVTEEEADSDEH